MIIAEHDTSATLTAHFQQSQYIIFSKEMGSPESPGRWPGEITSQYIIFSKEMGSHTSSYQTSEPEPSQAQRRVRPLKDVDCVPAAKRPKTVVSPVRPAGGKQVPLGLRVGVNDNSLESGDHVLWTTPIISGVNKIFPSQIPVETHLLKVVDYSLEGNSG
jgi:hypothetical protein